MSIIRKHTLMAALASTALLFSVGACSKEKGAEGDKPGEAKNDEGASRGTPAKSSYAYLPKTSNVVIGIAPTQITDSAMFKQIFEPMIKQQAGDDYSTIQESCLGSMKHVIIGGESEKEDTMVVSVSGLNRTNLKACAEASAKLSKEEMEISDEGDLTKIVSQGEAGYMGWINDTTMVMGSEAKEKAAVEAIVKRNEGLSDVMTGLVGKTDTGASIWFAMQNPKPEEPAGGLPYKIKSAQGSISMTSGLKLDLGAEAVSPEEAKKIVEEITTQLNGMKSQPQFGKFAGKAEIKADGSQVNLTLALSDADVGELIPIVQQQVAPLMMMMMMSAGGGMDAHGDMGGAEDTATEE